MGIVFANSARNRHLITAIEAVLGPSRSRQFVGGGELTLPVFDFFLVVLDIEEDQRMGIDKPEICNSAFERDGIAHVVSRAAMVSERRG